MAQLSIDLVRCYAQAEVQAVHQDGIVLLHTRSAKYGLLKDGQLVHVSACLIKRQRQHMIVLEDLGVQMILGCNGLIWVGAPMSDDSHDDLEPVGIEQGLIKSIARVVQSIKALSHLRRMISTLSVTKVVSLSIEMQISPPSMLGTHFLEMVATLDFAGLN
jgi:exosome complex component RRP4